MGFRHPVNGALGRWVVLPQGTSQSPALFCEVTNSAGKIFNAHFETAGISTRCFVFVDDFILVADTHAHMRLAFQIMDDLSSLLGMAWNPDKGWKRWASS